MKRFTAILLTGMMIFYPPSCGKKHRIHQQSLQQRHRLQRRSRCLQETEAVTEVVTEAAKDTQQTEAQQEEQTAEQPDEEQNNSR